MVDEISTEIEYISDYYGYYGYYGGSMQVVGNEREVESQSGSQGAYSYTADVNVDLSEYGCSSGPATVSGVSAGKFILFISANGSETGTAYDESEFWDALVREVALTEYDMQMLYPQ
jgi:hypothetical protein